jgi:hypothetical protein
MGARASRSHPPYLPAIAVAIALAAAVAAAQPAAREPQIGYLYPAGGQQGATFTILAGGQLLRGVRDVHVSGDGVRATVLRYYRPLRNLNQEQRQEIFRRLKARRDQLTRDDQDLRRFTRAFAALDREKTPATAQPVDLPDHPLLDRIDTMTLPELAHAWHELLNIRKRQPNVQLAETALIEIAIDASAPHGDRELRLLTPAGLTNPLRFQVGQYPELRELEPNDPDANSLLPKPPPAALPVVINGQIMPGDVDRFAFRAQRGQRLVIQVHARRLIPYLADAVPGWFQATLALYDPNGAEIAFEDDYRFDPDPVLLHTVTEDGVYHVEIRDAIYRGREDFVYRVTIGELPFVTHVFPLGGPTGAPAVAAVAGVNLGQTHVTFDTTPADLPGRNLTVQREASIANSVTFALDTLTECLESEPNDTKADAHRLELPRIVNGRIDRPGDVDVFAFEGRAGDRIVAEIRARRLGSPLDALLRLTNAAGDVLAWNDDHEDNEFGLLTHHADPYLIARLPQDGTYYVHVSDAQRHGGEPYAYRLRLGPPQPDVALRITPSSINVPPGRAVPVTLHALRKDGFDGEIEVAIKDAPQGFRLDGGTIPAGRERIRMTLTAPLDAPGTPVALVLEARALLDGHPITRPVGPADELMQAFLYRHLAPAQELLVALIRPNRRQPPVHLVSHTPLRIPEGGSAELRLRTPRAPTLENLRLQLDEPPPGLSLHGVRALANGLAFQIKAGPGAARGLTGNLIVEASTEAANPRQSGANQTQRVSLGFLPAIPFEIVPN